MKVCKITMEQKIVGPSLNLASRKSMITRVRNSWIMYWLVKVLVVNGDFGSKVVCLPRISLFLLTDHPKVSSPLPMVSKEGTTILIPFHTSG